MLINLYAIAGLVLMLALAGAGLVYEKGEVKTAQAEKALAIQADESHQLQNKRLQKENDDLKQQGQFKDEVLSSQQDDIKDLQTKSASLQAQYEREKRHVNQTPTGDDGIAAPVLQYTLNSLCERAQAVAAMSSGDSGKASVFGIQPRQPADSAGASPFCVTIRKQSEFASIVLDFAQAYQLDAHKLVTIRSVVGQYNAKVAEMNKSGPQK